MVISIEQFMRSPPIFFIRDCLSIGSLVVLSYDASFVKVADFLRGEVSLVLSLFVSITSVILVSVV